MAILDPVVQIEVARNINLIGRNPEMGRLGVYIPGLRFVRASRAHYLIVYRTVEKLQKVVVICILPHQEDPARPVKPYSKRAGQRERLKRLEARKAEKQKREEERKFEEMLDEENRKL